MMSVDSPIIYSQSEDRGHLEGVIYDVERLSIGPKADTPTEVEPCNVVEDMADVTLDNSKKDDKLNGTHRGALGFDSSVNRTREIGTCNSPELSQMTSNMAIEQQTGGLVSVEEHAAALETIKHQKELIEKLSKEKGIADESLVHNKQSVVAVAASGQTSLKEVVDDGKEEWIEDIIPAIYSNERMRENDRWKIQKHMKSLWLNIEPKELIIELHSLFVFDDDDFVDLLDYVERKGRSNGALQILTKLYRKGPNSYILFLVALERCNHTWVIKTLEPDCVICEGRIKYSGQKYYELIDNTSPKYGEFVRRCEKNIEDVYDDYPGQQFVVVKKLEKGCVEVTFHLISLGYNNEEDLRRPLEDLVKSGSIDTDPVKPDEFYFRQITDKELASKRESMTQRRIIVLEKEIETLKLQIIGLQLENAALRGTSANSQEVETYKEHLAKKYTDTLQDKELIISSLIEQLDQQATASNVDIVRADGERLEKENDDNLNEQLDQCESIDWADDERLELEKEMTIAPIDDYQDKERLHQGKALTALPVDDDQDKDTVEKGAASTDRKIEQIIDYLYTCHPHELGPLVQLLKDKDVLDDDDSIRITEYIDKDDVKRAAWRLSNRLTLRPNSYQYLIESVKDLGFWGLEYMIDKGSTDRKIEQIIDYLVTCQRDKLRPLVQLLKDKDVIDDDDRRIIIMYMDRDDIKRATWRLSTTLTLRPNSYQYLIESVKELGFSDVDDMIDKGSSVGKKEIQQSKSAGDQRKIEQIFDYLVTFYPNKKKPLIHLLNDKLIIDIDESKLLIRCFDIDNSKYVVERLSKRVTSNPDSNYYQYVIGCVKELGLSDVVDMFDKGSSDEMLVEYQRKIRHILAYLVTCRPHKLRPLVQLLKDKDVIDDDDSKFITMYIDRLDIRQAAWALSTRLTYTPDPRSYPYLIGCRRMLDLPDLEYMIDKGRIYIHLITPPFPIIPSMVPGDVDILKPPISVEQASLDKFDVEQLKPLGTKKPDLTREKDTSQSRSSPD